MISLELTKMMRKHLKIFLYKIQFEININDYVLKKGGNEFLANKKPRSQEEKPVFDLISCFQCKSYPRVLKRSYEYLE